ncbi:MAG: DUF4166 domain-containing protein [Candidatus Accumulibacter sp.]|jgi:hypothetical protein|uniref:DUF4166 domain-containing protein n=1 Tax=Accumulibacter sp. TaxID=2053492 RepID=UPI0025853153|nr:DUF4166 domain-containing protein [Accumulibacter sp.]MBK8114675.1 DUF4166 domain-containing protein [Accumulibacter sp.]
MPSRTRPPCPTSIGEWRAGGVLRVVGALVDRRDRQVPAVVEKSVVGDRQHWRRTITYPDGRVPTFNRFWVAAGGNQIIEFVNPVLGLQMAAHVEGGRLHCHGFRFVVKLRQLLLPIQEWLLLGRSSIVEEAMDETHFVMDFPLTYPLFGQVFRYSGEFEAS